MGSATIRRRDFRRWAAGSAAFISSMSGSGKAAQTKDEAGPAPVRAITRGPKFHWFGYYDKFQVDSTGRYALGMEVDFEHRSKTMESQPVCEKSGFFRVAASSAAWRWRLGGASDHRQGLRP